MTLIVLAPERTAPLEGAELIWAECSHRAWAAPQTKALLGAGDVQTTCMDCWDGIGELELAPGAREFLTAALGAPAADVVLAEGPSALRT